MTKSLVITGIAAFAGYAAVACFLGGTADFTQVGLFDQILTAIEPSLELGL